MNIFKNRTSSNVNRRKVSSKDNSISPFGRKPSRSFMMPWAPHLVSALVLMILTVVMGWHFNKASIVDQIEISGNVFTETSEIVDRMAVHEGNQVDSLNFLVIMKEVERMPYVKQAFIKRFPSGEIQLRVKEREPVVLLIEANQGIYVDSEGIRMPTVPGKSVDVPLLYATSPEMNADTLNGEIFVTVNKFLQSANNHPSADITISEIAWSDSEGVIVLSHDGYRLVFGNEDFDNRLQKWMTFYTGKILSEGESNMGNIDLRFEGQIVTK